MNKLVNLIIIFLTLQYLVPQIKIQSIQDNHMYLNIFTGLCVGLVQFIYNYGMKFSNRKNTTFNQNAIDSLFKMLLVVGGLYIYEDVGANPDLTTLKYNEFFRSAFVTLLVTFFILLNCLIIP